MADDTVPAEVQLSEKETLDATKQGLKDAVAEKAKIANAMFDDLPGEEPDIQWHGSDEVLGLEGFQDLGVDDFKKAISEKDGSLSTNQVAGIYKLERNGKNRTPYVAALRDRLGLKKGEDVPGAGGPPYTNDVSNITAL